MIRKLLRTITAVLPVDAGRTGACNHCGACCKLPFRCLFLVTDGDGKSRCAIYRFRPPSCRRFPRTRRQHGQVAQSCGYRFDSVQVPLPVRQETPESGCDGARDDRSYVFPSST